MRTKNRSTETENPKCALDTAKNYFAGLLLVGSVVFGSPDMLKAAERYLKNSGQKVEGNTEQMATQLYTEFEKNLQREFGGNKDLMLESLLMGPGSDMTVEGRKIYEKEMRGRFGDALKTTLKESGLCKGLKEDVKCGIISRFLGQEAGDGNDSFLERALGKGKNYNEPARESPGEKGYLLGAKRMNISTNASLSGGEINVSGSLTLEDFGLGMLRFDRGKFVCGNQGLKLELEKKVISDEIYSVFFRLKDFDNPRIDMGVGLAKGDLKKGVLSASLGYSTGNNEEGRGDGELYGGISWTKYLN